MYSSDLKDQEWQSLAHRFDRPDPRGNPGKYAKRDIVNAILYVLKCRIPWRMLPKDFPPWDTVYDHYRRWIKRGVWPEALRAIREVQNTSSPIHLRSTASALSRHSFNTPKPITPEPVSPDSNSPEPISSNLLSQETVSHH